MRYIKLIVPLMVIACSGASKIYSSKESGVDVKDKLGKLYHSFGSIN